jgi:hypothetical protein
MRLVESAFPFRPSSYGSSPTSEPAGHPFSLWQIAHMVTGRSPAQVPADSSHCDSGCGNSGSGQVGFGVAGLVAVGGLLVGLDVLRDLLVGRRCWTTEIVFAELNRGLVDYPMLVHVSEQEWLLIVGLDSIAGSVCTTPGASVWARQNSTREKPASFAATEQQAATAITDDRRAAQVGRFHRLDVHGTVWLLAGASRHWKLSLGGTGALI